MNDTKEAKRYEIGFIARTDAGVQEVLRLLQSAGASIDLQGPVQQVQFAYPVKKHESGYFGYIQFSLLPDKARGLDGELKLSKDLLRTLVVLLPKRTSSEMVKSGRVNAQEPRFAKGAQEESKPEALTNEALEKKIEEILQ